MKKVLLFLAVLTMINVSCKKVKLKRLSIGDEKRMVITEVDKKVTTAYIETPLLDFLDTDLDLDGDGSNDVLIRLILKSEHWVENEGDNLPWSLNLKVLNSNFLIREITGSEAFYYKYETSYDEAPDGTPMEIYDSYIGCENLDGATSITDASHIHPGDLEGEFEADENGNWSQGVNGNNFIIAQSPEVELTFTDVETSESLIIETNYKIVRNCVPLDKSKPVFIQFKTGNEEYRMGWIELVFESDSFTIKRHGISEKFIKE